MSELGIYDLKEIEVMTLTEFNYRMYAREYEMLKEEYDIYRLAFAIRDAKAEQKKKAAKKARTNSNITVQTTLSTIRKTSKDSTEVNPFRWATQTSKEMTSRQLMC
ncbi:hypothetical protein [Staphylococcus equorum]|uniref:hypothetical protein n=1 Tax=Staphylococcus equorum TaxID=246432 RepID=UPI0020CDFA8A|nr:hypothetical protein [Staphylococcus equorum]UTT55209.1 hypothetical protein NMQ06_08710 [Staphylococcus equorum]